MDYWTILMIRLLKQERSNPERGPVSFPRALIIEIDDVDLI